MNMKKIVFTGIILVLVMMFVVTCDTPAAEEVEYTDVVYSPDGSKITLYLDGVGVPVTPAQRAINKELATMAFDFFEVIFVAGANASNQIARTSWELGQAAGIADVPRGTLGTGIDYGYTNGKAILAEASVTNIACMFVGKKSDRTLLGIGTLTSRTQKPGTTAPTVDTAVDGNTSSVVFSIAAIQTGLLVGTTETIAPAPPAVAASPQVPGVMFDSFKYKASSLASDHALGNFTTRTANNSTRSSVNGSPLSYPRYRLPAFNSAWVDATYEFTHIGYDPNNTTPANVKNFFAFAKVINNSTTTAPFANNVPKAQKRVPRFMNGGRYMEPKEGWTTTTSVALAVVDGSANYSSITTNTPFTPKVGLRFTITGSGVFSFYLDIPVYMLVVADATYNGAAVAPELWKIRTGVGSELYSLDDGAANGGCVFMSVGESAANWLDIDWVWL